MQEFSPVLAFAYAGTLGLMIGMSPSLVRCLAGAWGIMGVAGLALLIGPVDIANWALQLLFAVLGYNLSLIASLLMLVRSEATPA